MITGTDERAPIASASWHPLIPGIKKSVSTASNGVVRTVLGFRRRPSQALGDYGHVSVRAARGHLTIYVAAGVAEEDETLASDLTDRRVVVNDE
jgi:hypothetical protein